MVEMACVVASHRRTELQNVLLDNDGKVQILALSAGNVASTVNFEVSTEGFRQALTTFLADDKSFRAFELPARQLEITETQTGLTIAEWSARRPQRIAAAISWREVARYLVS